MATSQLHAVAMFQPRKQPLVSI